MKKIIFIFVLLSCSSVIVHAQDLDLYFSGNIGMAMMLDAETTDARELPGITLDLGYDNGLALSGAVGLYGTDNNFRAEIELSHQNHDLDEIDSTSIANTGLSGDASVTSALMNAYYDFETGSAITPYITGGLGFSKVNLEFAFDDGTDDLSIDDSDTDVAFQIGAGVGYAVNENITFDLRYRFFAAPTVKFDSTESEVMSHILTGGLRVRF